MYNITLPIWRHMHDTSLKSLTLRLCVHHTWRYVNGGNVHVKQYCKYAQKILHLDFHAHPITYQKCTEQICLLSLSIPRVFMYPWSSGRAATGLTSTTCMAMDSMLRTRLPNVHPSHLPSPLCCWTTSKIIFGKSNLLWWNSNLQWLNMV